MKPTIYTNGVANALSAKHADCPNSLQVCLFTDRLKGLSLKFQQC